MWGWPGIRGVFKELSFVGENNQSNFSITENRDFMSLLQQTSFPFGESNLPVYFVLNSFQLNPTSSHFYNPTPKEPLFFCLKTLLFSLCFQTNPSSQNNTRKRETNHKNRKIRGPNEMKKRLGFRKWVAACCCLLL